METAAAFVARSIEVHLGARPEHIDQLPSGPHAEIFRCHLADRTVLFKADRVDRARGVVLEAWACQHARELGAPVPNVLAVDLARDSYPRNFILVEDVAGTPLPEAGLGHAAHRRAVEAAGEGLRKVHEIGMPGYGYLDEATYLRTAHVQGACDTWAGYLADLLLRTLPALTSAGLLAEAGAVRVEEVLDAHTDYLEVGPVGHLLHGSFEPSRILVSGGRLVAIIDFQERLAGDPAWDLGSFFLQDAASTERLMRGYDPHPDRLADFEITVPLCGSLRALELARRAFEDGNRELCDQLLERADASFRALGHP